MKKRIFTILITLALLLGATILTAIPSSAAIQKVLYVGGVEVTEQNAADVFGDGTVSFDFTTSTLTLNNAAITEHHTAEFFDENTYFGIYCEALKLNINLIGENTINIGNDPYDDSYYAIYTTGNLNIYGEGSLDVVCFGGIAAMGDMALEDCTLDFSVCGINCMESITLENATVYAKNSTVMALGDITANDSSLSSNGMIFYTEGAGTISVENSTITTVGAIAPPIYNANGSVSIKNSTLDVNVNLIGEESVMGIYAGNQLTLDNVSGSIASKCDAGYALAGIAKVTVTNSNLEISQFSYEDSAIGIFSGGNIKIESSNLDIEATGMGDMSGAIGTMTGDVDVKNSNLSLSSTGTTIFGVLGINVSVSNSDTLINVNVIGDDLYSGFGCGIMSMGGTLTVSGGAMDITAIGPFDSETGGIMVEGQSSPVLNDVYITVRGSAAAMSIAPNLSLYGREYVIEASEDIDCDFTAEYDKENILSYKYIFIHGWYTVTFNANGGTGSMESESDACGLLFLPENDFTAPNEKYFVGWALSPSGEAIKSSRINVDRDLTLYAVWESIPTDPGNNGGGSGSDPNGGGSGSTPNGNGSDNDPNGGGSTPDPNPSGSGNAHTHTFSAEWKNTADEHYKDCVCGAKQYQSAHIDSNANGSCDVCGYVISSQKNDGGGLGTGAIIAIVIGSLSVVGIGGFSIVWFVKKKKNA